jgi:NAD(P)-dependent dehydrogenase (short-subunit alcohol dehydrogenase family)
MRAVMTQQPGLQDKIAALTTAEERMGTPEDIGFVVGFLASEEGRWINGAAVQGKSSQKDVRLPQGGLVRAVCCSCPGERPANEDKLTVESKT